jgi:hypothetical protein
MASARSSWYSASLSASARIVAGYFVVERRRELRGCLSPVNTTEWEMAAYEYASSYYIAAEQVWNLSSAVMSCRHGPIADIAGPPGTGWVMRL